jgi:two-component sensor histidine kinase
VDISERKRGEEQIAILAREADLRKLATEELAPYCQDGEARVQLDGANLVLEPSAAQAIAVTMHELATNAAKYGALSVPDGRVQIAWSHTADGQLIIRWSESGGPPVQVATRNASVYA